MKKKLLLMLLGTMIIAVAATALTWSPPADAAPPSCEDRCQKKFDRCIHQGNDRDFCFDLVFCECMCNECNNCIC